MDEKDILLKTIEGLNASVASLSAINKDQSEQIKNLKECIKELTARVTWLKPTNSQTCYGLNHHHAF